MAQVKMFILRLGLNFQGEIKSGQESGSLMIQKIDDGHLKLIFGNILVNFLIPTVMMKCVLGIYMVFGMIMITIVMPYPTSRLHITLLHNIASMVSNGQKMI